MDLYKNQLLPALFVIFVLTGHSISAQNIKAAPKDNDPVHEFADEMPFFESDYVAYLSEHVSYPAEAMKNNIQGTVYLSLIIGKAGEVESVQIVRNPGGGLGEEAAKVVREMPNWRPGKINGRPVRVKLMVPVKFVLQNLLPSETDKEK